MASRLAIVIALVHVFSVYAEENLQTHKEVIDSDRSEHSRALSRNCEKIYSTTCLKLDVISWVDKLNEAESYTVFPGVTVERENATRAANTAEIVADLARDFPGDPEARLDAFLLRKVQGFLGSHVVKVNLLGEDSGETARKGGGGGGGGKKGGGGMGYILAAAAMMKGTMMALALGGLAAMAGKALMTGMISLMLSAIIGLKSLSSGEKKTTYEVIAKPHYTQAQTYSASHEDYSAGGHGGGHSSGYGRSFDVPLPLSLQPGYAPQ